LNLATHSWQNVIEKNVDWDSLNPATDLVHNLKRGNTYFLPSHILLPMTSFNHPIWGVPQPYEVFRHSVAIV
jgi:hypothetical protein